MASVGINKVILAGNLGKDPEVRHLEGGAVVANFPLATTETYKDKNGNKIEQTEWHNIVLWRAQAEYAEKFLKKGFTILVEGKLKHVLGKIKTRIKDIPQRFMEIVLQY
jgi:single-strand DNA-binding protein